MKVLLDVSKTLLLINGAIVLPIFLLLTTMYKEQSPSIATADSVSSKFHRNIQDDTPDYKQKLEQLEDQKKELQAQLEASQKAKTVTPVMAERPSVNPNLTKVSPVSQPQMVTASSRPYIKTPVVAKATTVPKTKPPLKLSKRSVGITPVSPPRKRKVAVTEEKRPSQPLSEANVALSPSKTNKLSPAHKSSDQGKTVPKGFISLDDLNKKHQKQQKPFSYSIVASQGKSAMDLSKDLAAGLIVAGNRNELSHTSTNYKKVQTAIGSLRNGSSQTLEDASRRAGIDLETLQWVAYYGQQRPGGIQVSRANSQ